LNNGLSLGRKLFEEIDKATGSKVVAVNDASGLTERESTWTGNIKGYNSFPSGIANGSGRSYIYSDSGVTISHWEGVFDTDNTEKITFKGRDMSKNHKFVVLRTYFTKSENLGWMNGLVCILNGDAEASTGTFKSVGYELVM
jgi:hypothetical protein